MKHSFARDLFETKKKKHFLFYLMVIYYLIFAPFGFGFFNELDRIRRQFWWQSSLKLASAIFYCFLKQYVSWLF